MLFYILQSCQKKFPKHQINVNIPQSLQRCNRKLIVYHKNSIYEDGNSIQVKKILQVGSVHYAKFLSGAEWFVCLP